MTKTVFSNDMVAHVFAQQNQDHGKSGNGNFYFEGDTIYSYGRHFPICRIVNQSDKIALINAHDYSVSTQRHISMTRQAMSHYTLFEVDELDTLEYSSDMSHKIESKRIHKANYAKMLERFQTEFDRVSRARDNTWNRLASMSQHMLAYSQYFKLGYRVVPVPGPEQLAERKAELKRASQKQANKTRKIRDTARKLYANEIIAWRNGHGSDYDYPGRYPEGLTPTESDKKSRLTALWTSQHAESFRQGESSWSIRDYMSVIPESDFAAYAESDKIKPLIEAYCSGESDTRPYLVQLTPGMIARRQESVSSETEAWSQGYLNDCPIGGNPTQEQIDRRHGVVIRQWRNGANVRIPGDIGPLMRVKGDNIETSQHASFPVDMALKAFPFIARCRENKTIWQRNGQTIKLGSFQIDKIDDSGNVRAGCHFVAWSEIERCALELGVL